MSPIPARIKAQILDDPFYERCSRSSPECSGRITWEHAFTYAGKQVQEAWAIIPLCWHHHLGSGLVKRENQRIAASRASDADRAKYPKLSWHLL